MPNNPLDINKGLKHEDKKLKKWKYKEIKIEKKYSRRLSILNSISSFSRSLNKVTVMQMLLRKMMTVNRYPILFISESLKILGDNFIKAIQ